MSNSAREAASGLYNILIHEFSIRHKLSHRLFGELQPKELPNAPLELPHLLWMLRQIIDGKLSSATKEHRWLGYVQGVMAVHGILDVSEERDRTRTIFNGE